MIIGKSPYYSGAELVDLSLPVIEQQVNGALRVSAPWTEPHELDDRQPPSWNLYRRCRAVVIFDRVLNKEYSSVKQ